MIDDDRRLIDITVDIYLIIKITDYLIEFKPKQTIDDDDGPSYKLAILKLYGIEWCATVDI